MNTVSKDLLIFPAVPASASLITQQKNKPYTEKPQLPLSQIFRDSQRSRLIRNVSTEDSSVSNEHNLSLNALNNGIQVADEKADSNIPTTNYGVPLSPDQIQFLNDIALKRKDAGNDRYVIQKEVFWEKANRDFAIENWDTLHQKFDTFDILQISAQPEKGRNYIKNNILRLGPEEFPTMMNMIRHFPQKGWDYIVDHQQELLQAGLLPKEIISLGYRVQSEEGNDFVLRNYKELQQAEFSRADIFEFANNSNEDQRNFFLQQWNRLKQAGFSQKQIFRIASLHSDSRIFLLQQWEMMKQAGFSQDLMIDIAISDPNTDPEKHNFFLQQWETLRQAGFSHDSIVHITNKIPKQRSLFMQQWPVLRQRGYSLDEIRFYGNLETQEINFLDAQRERLKKSSLSVRNMAILSKSAARDVLLEKLDILNAHHFSGDDIAYLAGLKEERVLFILENLEDFIKMKPDLQELLNFATTPEEVWSSSWIYKRAKEAESNIFTRFANWLNYLLGNVAS